MIYYKLFYSTVTRKEGNDQESLQLPNTFRSRTPNGKQRHHNQNRTKSLFVHLNDN